MNDEERINYILELLEKNRNAELKKFYRFIRNTNSKLDDILINNSKKVFLETLKEARKYHYSKRRDPEIGLNTDMLYRLCNDIQSSFAIRSDKNDKNVLNFTKKFKKRVNEYILFATTGKYVEL